MRPARLCLFPTGVLRQLIMIMNRGLGALQGIGSKKACFWLPLGGASPRLPVELRPAGVSLGDVPPRLSVELRPAGAPLGDVPPRLPVELRPAGVPLGDAPPRLPVELRPAVILPVGGALVPPSFVGIGEVSNLVRYVGLNMARKLKASGTHCFFSPLLPSRWTAIQPVQFFILSQSGEPRSLNRRAGARSPVSED
jgi:hypothetical protein